jgi:hypothetical protein
MSQAFMPTDAPCGMQAHQLERYDFPAMHCSRFAAALGYV